MEKIKVLTVMLVALLLLNLGTLGFLFFRSHDHRLQPDPGAEKRIKPREIIISKLHFTAGQVVQYDKIIKAHRADIRNLDAKIRAAKNELYSLLKKEPTDAQKRDSIITLLSAYQKNIEATHFNHFEAIKKICTKEQLPDFDALTDELSAIFSRRPKPAHD